MEPIQPTIRGRGAATNLPNRFEPFQIEPDPEADPNDQPAPQTVFMRDTSRSIITRNNSPDVGFTASINPFRGCEHGCPYCYARNGHTYLGYSAGLDFETKIIVKMDAPDLLRKELASPRYRPETLSISGVTDCYQPAERKLKLTRGCLEVLAECRHPVSMITKNSLIMRDVDLLAELAKYDAAVAVLSITTLDSDLSRKMEPRASARSVGWLPWRHWRRLASR